MLKITITQEFETAADAMAFLDRVGVAPVSKGTAPQAPATGTPDQTAGATPSPQKRGPGRPRKTTGEPAAPSVTADQAGAAATAPAAPAAPTKPAAPAQASTPAPESAAPAAADHPSHEEAHAALKRLAATKGRGMEATIGLLQKHGVVKLSDVKPENRAALMAEIEQLIETAPK